MSYSTGLPPPYEHLQYNPSLGGQVVMIVLSRPRVHNCINVRLHRELIDAFDRFKSDDIARVAVITGEGDEAFCSGADLVEGADLAPLADEDVERHCRGDAPGLIGPTRTTDIYKPILAAVNGLAYAGGLEWALFADIRIAEEHASFGVTCRRWNVGLGDGGTQRLPRLIGLSRALDLILTGRVIDAQEAKTIGLVSEVVPKGQSRTRALQLAETLAGLPQSAMRKDKEAAVRGFGLPLKEGLRIEARCFVEGFRSPETLEGLKRFNDRDHPDRRKDGKAGSGSGVRRSRL